MQKEDSFLMRRLQPRLTSHSEDLASERLARTAELFEFLESRGVRYAVVGDFQRLAQDAGGDLDLVVDSLEGTPLLLQDFCQRSGARLVQVLEHEQTALYFVLAWSGEGGVLSFLQPDICSDYFRQGRLLLRAEELLARRVPARSDRGFSFYVPHPAMNFIYYLLKKIDKGDLATHHGELLSELWHQDPEGAGQQLDRFWRASEAELLGRAASTADWRRVLKQIPLLRSRPGKEIPRPLAHWIREQGRRMRRILHPTGLTVAFFGPDGSGKTSVVEGVARALAPSFRRTKVHHLRVGLVLRGPRTQDVARPHARPPRRGFVSCVQLCAWWLEYTLAFLVDLLPSTIRSTLVLFDRHAADLLVDPWRYRYGGPQWLASWMTRILPAPDLVILLDADPGILLQRKRELPPPEIVRQVEAYRRLVANLRQSHVVDASRPLTEVVGAASEIILAHIAARTARRHGLH